MGTFSRKAAILAMVPVCIMEMLTTQDFAVINAALAPMSRQFNVAVAELHWAISGQLLAIGGLLVVGGWLGDMFGKKWIFVIGNRRFFLCRF